MAYINGNKVHLCANIKITGGGENYEQGYEDGYDAGITEGYNDGYAQAESENPLYYVSALSAAWANREFPENYNLVVKVKKLPSTCNRLCENAKNLETVKIINEEPNSNNINMQNAFNGASSLISVDFSKFNNKFSNILGIFQNCRSLVSIDGELDVSNITDSNGAFYNNDSLEDIRFTRNSIKVSLGFARSSKLTHDSLMSIINGLKDLVHSEYDITNNTPSFVKPPFVNGIYTVTGTNADDVYLAVYTDKGTEMVFEYDDYSEEIINTLKAGTQFEIDCDYGEGDWDFTINSFKIISTNENVTKQTLTLGATNLAKLTDEEKAIATEKGWDLK